MAKQIPRFVREFARPGERKNIAYFVPEEDRGAFSSYGPGRLDRTRTGRDGYPPADCRTRRLFLSDRFHLDLSRGRDFCALRRLCCGVRPAQPDSLGGGNLARQFYRRSDLFLDRPIFRAAAAQSVSEVARRRRIGTVLAGAIQCRIYSIVSVHLRCPKLLLVCDGNECGSLEALPLVKSACRLAVGRQFRCAGLFPRPCIPRRARAYCTLRQPRHAGCLYRVRGGRLGFSPGAKAPPA